jgi:hypothetical protein
VRLRSWLVVAGVLLLMSAGLYWTGVQGQGRVRESSEAARTLLRRTDLGTCERGNGLRAYLRLKDPRGAAGFDLLDCALSVETGRTIAWPQQTQQAFLLMVQRCVGSPTPGCRELLNGAVATR